MSYNGKKNRTINGFWNLGTFFQKRGQQFTFMPPVHVHSKICFTILHLIYTFQCIFSAIWPVLCWFAIIPNKQTNNKPWAPLTLFHWQSRLLQIRFHRYHNRIQPLKCYYTVMCLKDMRIHMSRRCSRTHLCHRNRPSHTHLHLLCSYRPWNQWDSHTGRPSPAPRLRWCMCHRCHMGCPCRRRTQNSSCQSKVLHNNTCSFLSRDEVYMCNRFE